MSYSIFVKKSKFSGKADGIDNICNLLIGGCDASTEE
jgi:hypothetical protein